MKLFLFINIMWKTISNCNLYKDCISSNVEVVSVNEML